MRRLARANKHLLTARSAIANPRPLVGYCTSQTPTSEASIAVQNPEPEKPVTNILFSEKSISTKITEVLGQRNWKNLLNDSDLLQELKPEVVYQVIYEVNGYDRIVRDPKLLLDFFLWSEEKVGALWDFDVLSLIAVGLCNSKFYGDALDIIDRMIRISKYPYAVLGCIGSAYLGVVSSNPVVFEMLVDSYRKMGLLAEAVTVFLTIKNAEFVPTSSFCNTLLRDLLKTDKMELFWKVFDRISDMKLTFDVYTYSYVINAYAKAGNVDEVKKVLLEMEEKGFPPNVDTYNMVIHGLCGAGHVDEAVEIKGMKPDGVSYNSLIDGFIKQGNVEEALKMKSKMVSHFIEMDLNVQNTLLNGVCKAGMMENAREIVTEMINTDANPDSRTYNLLIEGYYRKHDMVRAFQMLDEMKKRSLAPTIHTYSAIINGLYLSRNFGQAKAAFGEMIKEGLEPNAFIYTIISAHAKEGKLEEARRIFESLTEQGIFQDVFCYNSLIISLCQSRKMDAARTYLDDMLESGLQPDAHTYGAFVHGYSEAGKMQMADSKTYSVVIIGLLKNGKMQEALRIFHELCGKGLLPDVGTCNALMVGLYKQGDAEKAIQLYEDMCMKGINPNVVTYDNLISFLCKAGAVEAEDMEEAERLFLEMQARNIEPTTVTYTSLLQGFNATGNTRRVFALFKDMMAKGIEPDQLAFHVIFDSLLREGKTVEAFKLGCALSAGQDIIFKYEEEEIGTYLV
ncbi:hypothetical protein FNV43_RR14968 [Rhamnella rubrinervis]|uniref:Pentatricopeptide repeat-containing protein n=1 Tax=Rhamnella rubrinervis TaxID=2594499 RepID=A0A8K0H4C4_9ROSA|nr:hypothetical protein FNV43_RR14968 [Rhamnella rubrinervis]